MIGRGKSYIVWLLGFIFAFFFGSGTALAQSSQTNDKKLDSRSLIKQMIEAQRDKNKQKPQWQVRPRIQYKYGIRPRPIIDGDHPVLKRSDMAGENFRANLYLNSLIAKYTESSIVKREREKALAELRKSGKAASEQVDRRIMSTEKLLRGLRKHAALKTKPKGSKRRAHSMKKRILQYEDRLARLQELRKLLP